MLELLMSMSANALLLFDETGRILRANQAASDLFGWTSGELQQKEIGALMPQIPTDLFPPFFAGSETNGRPVESRLVMARRKSGEEFPAEVSIARGTLDGQTALVASPRDVSEGERAEELIRQMTASLQRKLTFEELTAHLATKFMNASFHEVDAAVQDTLRRLGEFFEVDRVYIFEFTADGSAMNNTFEWCAGNVSPQIENLQGIPSSVVPWWMQFLERGETIVVPRVSEMPPEASSEQEILSGQGIQSVLVTPMLSGSGLFGFVGFDSVLHERNWTGDEVNLLNVLSGLITNTVIRQRSQRELLRQRDFAQTLTTQMGQGLTVTNAENRFEFVNPAYAKMLGYDPAQLIGKTPQEVTFEEDFETLLEAKSNRMQGKVTTYETRLRKADGSDLYAHITGAPRLVDGKYAGAIAVITDLTERRLMENSLRESEEAIRTLYEITALPEDVEHKIKLLLIMGMKRFGLQNGILAKVNGTEYEIIAAHSENKELLPGEIFDLNEVFSHEVIQTKSPICFERASGTQWENHPGYKSLKLEAYLGTTVMVDGRVYGTLSFSSHIPLPRPFSETDKDFIQLMAQWVGSEIRQMETSRSLRNYADEIQQKNLDLAEARDRALEASYLKSAFLATMSHEIRTPLNAVLGTSELLLDMPQENEQKEFLEIIYSSAKNLLTTLNEILDFSKIEAGKFILQSVPFQPYIVATETVELFRAKAMEKQIALEFTISPAIPQTLVGDPGRIRQILINFISNAIKFTDQGFVNVSVSGTPIGEEIIMTTFTVTDTGIGIPASHQDKLFEPFTQADSSITRKYGGTGLGLAISRRIVDLMQGDIGFESKVNSGTSFWFAVPLSRVEKKNKSKIVETGTPKESLMTFEAFKPILVVEDNLINRDLLSIQLKEFSASLRFAGNGLEALELIQTQPDKFSLVLMDLNMPGMDGLTATQRIRDVEVTTKRHIPIIAITANATEESRQMCLKAGMDDFIGKPYSKTRLNEVLKKWMPNQD